MRSSLKQKRKNSNCLNVIKMMLTNVAETSWFDHSSGKKVVSLYKIGYDSETKKRKIVKVSDFIPYLYISKDYGIDYIQQSSQSMKVEDCEIKSLFGETVKKVSISDFSEFDGVYAQIFDSYEADVKFSQRLIIDDDLKFYKEQRILYFDIETDMSIDAFNTPQPIISISAYDAFEKKYTCFVYHFGTLQHVDIEGATVRSFSSEKGLLEAFLSYFQKVSPDIVTGWNADHFDLPYLINRCAKLGLNFRIMSPINSVYVRVDEDKGQKKISASIKGVSIVDLRSVFKKIPFAGHAPENFKLDTIAKYSLGLSKKSFGKVGDLWRNNVCKLVEYNLYDVELVVKIEEKVKLINYFLTVQQIVPINLEDVFFNTKVIDALMLKKFHGRYVFPTKKMNAKQSFKGAFVFETLSGIFDGVSVLDFASMYPSIYVTFNISPETINSEGDVKIDECRFSTKKLGVIPEMLLYTLNERERFKVERDKYDPSSREWSMYSDLQDAFKEINNSMYGCMAYENFRLFNITIAGSITSVGRELINFASKIAEKEGFTIIGGDTDSVFVWKKDNSLKESERLQETINKSLHKFVAKFTDNKSIVKKHRLKIEFERFYESIFFTGVKKRYYGHLVFKKGKKTDEWYGRGFDHVRRDTPDCFKVVLKAVYKKILLKESPVEIRRFIEIEKEKIKMLPALEIGSTKTFNKEFESYKTTPQHVRAFKYSNDYLGTQFTMGDQPKVLFVKESSHGQFPKTNVIGIDDDVKIPDCFKIDYGKFFDVFIEKKLELLESVIRIPTDLNQTSLLNYLGDDQNQKRSSLGDF